MPKISLGDKVKCKVTGFTGIATGRIEYLNGCDQIGVKPKMSADKKYPDTLWIDEHYLQVVQKKSIAPPVLKKDSGGPDTIIKIDRF